MHDHSILIVGHGSETDPETSEPILIAAQAIREQHDVEVEVAFYKGQPSLVGALDRMKTEPIVVVPFFMAEGYYVGEVVPRELGLETTSRDVRYTAPIGLSESLWKDALQIVAAIKTVRKDLTGRVVVAGHGTPRNASSRDAAVALAERFRATGFDCVAAFIDDDPRLEDVLEQGDLIFPMFAGYSGHVRDDIIEAFPGAFVTTPMGLLLGVPETILELAHQAIT